MSSGNKSNYCTVCKKMGETKWHQLSSSNIGLDSNFNQLFSYPTNRIELCNICDNKSKSLKGQENKNLEKYKLLDKTSKKQKSNEGKILAKQKFREGKFRDQKVHLERRGKQERITSKKRKLQ